MAGYRAPGRLTKELPEAHHSPLMRSDKSSQNSHNGQQISVCYSTVTSGLADMSYIFCWHLTYAHPDLVMSNFERVLAEGSTELPDCRCSVEMHLISIVPVPGGGSETRIFRCPDCDHELRLTIWHNDVSGRAN